MVNEEWEEISYQEYMKDCNSYEYKKVNSDPIEKAYDCVKLLTDKGMKQINFHVIAHDKSYDKIMSIIDDIKTDKRLEKLNAIVLLKYKPKGNGKGRFHSLPQNMYDNIVQHAIHVGVGLGFDSCSAPSFFEVIKKNPELDYTKIFVEPCESSLFSAYINCHGEFYACSFCENEKHTVWETGIPVGDNFEQVWYNEKTKRFRNLLLNNKRKCPMFNLEEE